MKGNLPSTSFSSVLYQKAETYLQDKRRENWGQSLLYIKAIGILGLFFWTYLYWLKSGHFLSFIQFAILLGVCHVLIPVNIVHDATHGAFSKKFWVNQLALLSLHLVGCNPRLYQKMHLKAHNDKENGSRRKAIDSQQLLMKRSPIRNLPAIFYLFYSFYMIFIRDFKLFSNDKENPKPLEWIAFVLPKLGYFLAIWIAPFIFVPIPAWQIVIGIFTIYLSITVLLIIILLMPTSPLTSSKEDANKNVNDFWLKEILLNNVDFSPKSHFLNFLVGGANMNVVHYIFPNVSHIHYVGLAKIIKETAEDFQIDYREQNVIDVFGIHWQYMMELGKK